MSEPVKIVIVVQGGGVREVKTLGVPVQYLLIDFDTDGEDEADLTPVTALGDDPHALAHVHVQGAAQLIGRERGEVEALWRE